MKITTPLLAVVLASAASADITNGPPTGLFCGKLPFIIKENMTVYGNSTFDYHNDVMVAKIHIDCFGEKFEWDSANNDFNLTAIQKDPTDCLAKASATYKTGFPSFTFDGTNIVSKNKYGKLKMKPVSGTQCP